MRSSVPKKSVPTALGAAAEEEERGMLSRRQMVGRLAAGAAVVCTAGVARANTASTRNEMNALTGSAPDAGQLAHSAPPTEEIQEGQEIIDAQPPASAPAPWALVRPLALGSVVAHGWRVADLTGVIDGSCVLTLQNQRGRAHRVHLCRNDGRPQGLVHTERLDLVVMNGGQGDLPTEEGLAQAVAEVAHILAANESGRQQEPVVVALLAHAERVRLFTGPVDRRLR